MCLRNFSSAKYLQQHQKKHKLAFRCKLCLRVFNRKFSCRRHVTLRHAQIKRTFSPCVAYPTANNRTQLTSNQSDVVAGSSMGVSSSSQSGPTATSSGRVAQSVGHLTRKSGILGSIPGLATYFRFSFRFFKKGSCQLLAKACARSTG